MHLNYSERELITLLHQHADDILMSEGMQSEKGYKQHGDVNCYEHSVSVACISVKLALFFHIKVDMKSMIRGALLHDYFLYDWHDTDKNHRLHGFFHAERALENADRDFVLTDVERDVIVKHMFPLNLHLPRYRESMVVSIADKICAFREVLSFAFPKMKMEESENGVC